MNAEKMTPIAELIGRTTIMRDVMRSEGRDDLADACAVALVEQADLARATIGQCA